jgi:hypothetical protein
VDEIALEQRLDDAAARDAADGVDLGARRS